jgi:hypothetical protein
VPAGPGIYAGLARDFDPRGSLVVPRAISENDKCEIAPINSNNLRGLSGGRTRTRTLDPLIKSLPEQADTARQSRTSRHREPLELAGVTYIC